MRRDAQNAAAEGNLAALRSAASMYYSNSAIYTYMCQTPYRSSNATAPCFPGSTAELEALLVSEPVWPSGGGQCYNAVSGATGGC